MANTDQKIHIHMIFVGLIIPIRQKGGRLWRGIFTRVTSSIPPVETGGYDFVYA